MVSSHHSKADTVSRLRRVNLEAPRKDNSTEANRRVNSMEANHKVSSTEEAEARKTFKATNVS